MCNWYSKRYVEKTKKERGMEVALVDYVVNIINSI